MIVPTISKERSWRYGARAMSIFAPIKQSTMERPDFQVAEKIDRAGEDKIERAQSKNRKDVRSKNNEGIRRDAENRGNRIDGENQIGRFDHHQHQSERGQHAAPMSHGVDEFRTVEIPCVIGKNRRVRRMNMFFSGSTSFVGGGKDHLNAGENQESAEDVEHEFETLDQGGARPIITPRMMSAPRIPQNRTRC